MLDFRLCSHSLLFKFINCLQDGYKLRHAGQLGYIDAISELIDSRKINGAFHMILGNLSSTELYLKIVRKAVSKMMRLQWKQDLDFETLELH